MSRSVKLKYVTSHALPMRTNNHALLVHLVHISSLVSHQQTFTYGTNVSDDPLSPLNY